MRPAALMRGARRKATSKPVSCLAAGSSAAAAKSARRPAPTGRRSSRRPSAAMVRFSPRRGTASAMVAMAAILRKLGSVFSRARRRIAALEQRLRELERDGCAAERFFRIRAAGLIGIQDGERGGKRVVRVGQVVVGDDEIEAQPARGFRFGKGAHAGVDGDDEADAFGVGRFEHARLHAVAVAQAMRNVKARHAAEHFDGGFEQDDGDGSVHVVVAVEKHGLARGDGALEPVDGCGHAQHEEGIVQVGGLGIEEGVGLGGGGDAARDEQLGEHQRQARFAGEGSGFFRVRFGEEPALRRQTDVDARQWRLVFGPGGAHADYSSSSSCE